MEISALVYFCVCLKFSKRRIKTKKGKETTQPGLCVCLVLCVANASHVVWRWCCLQSQKYLLSGRITPPAPAPKDSPVLILGTCK